MNPVVEQWFEELDEGGDELKEFIRQTSDVIITEMGIPPQLIEYLQARNLALVPTSRLWWENPPSKLFGAVRPQSLVPPGHVGAPEDEAEEMLLPGVQGDVEETQDFRERIRHGFIEGALEGIVVGQPVNYLTAPAGPMHQSDTGTGAVTKIHGQIVGVKTDQGREIEVDMGAGGRITLRR